MAIHHTNEPSNVEGTSTLPRFTSGELLAMLIRLFEQYELENNEEITDPCLQCLRWVVSGRGNIHIHVPPESNSGSESPTSSIWDDLSPNSTFLAEHLPSVIADESWSSTAEAPAGVGNGLDVPGAVRAQPLDISPTGATAGSVTDSLAESLEGMSMTPSMLGSLYSTPEHVPTPLVARDAQPAIAEAPIIFAADPTPADDTAPIVPAGGLPPIIPYIALPSTASTWYVVTRGRRVGVFDTCSMMVDAVSRVSGGTGRGGFPTRESAIAAFRRAVADGIVSIV
ncbi:hypothetical protein L227DRAFT_615560 [Lentinus tigrinus ALCF2SS1-6]|uniref:Uncharacterized protein n=1 Tax=Lentinus tigrinus ALCF2SS1-6 TaxID=1328759 RepID=A0A5C2RVN4_9APHY|nr:hypothetical protein L227DRAFT_615560 [Lentinus tigrinus ALCF2SS1-6]